jgi:hypothetical protein
VLDTSASFGIDAPLAISGATSAAPTAGTSVCSIAAPPAGKYRISAVTRQTGTPDVVAFSKNMSLRLGTTVIQQLSSTPDTGNWFAVDITVDGASTINIVVGAANAGVGAVYRGAIVATRMAT